MKISKSSSRRLACAAIALAAAACDPASNGRGAPQPASATELRAADAPPKAGLCEHGVPSATCTKCNPALAAVFKSKGDWCKEHDVPESQCTKCNPSLTFANVPSEPGRSGEAPWCKEHAVPEDKCTKCHPELIAKFVEADDYCREHGFPESVCPYCHPEAVKAAGHDLPVFPEPGTKVRLATPETEKEAGIESEKVVLRPISKSLDVIGHLDFNENKLAKMSSRGEAVIEEVKVDTGDRVKRGQPLVVLASGNIGENQSKLVASRARLEAARSALAREESLAETGVSSKRDVEQARAEVATAQAELDASKAALRAVGATEENSIGRYVLAAPFDGTVVARDAVAGKSVASDTTLIEIADVDTMWAILDVPEDQIGSVAIGQRVILSFEAMRGQKVEARVDRIAASIDPSTRTVRVRADVANPDGKLRAGLFLRAQIEIGDKHSAIVVPEGSVQRAQETDLVFVRTAPGQYDPTRVVLGQRRAGFVEIAEGLEPGDDIVTTGAFLLKTEILKDSIGAGCADD